METWQALHARVMDSLIRVRSENGSGAKSAVFSSGGIIAVLTAEAMKAPATGVYPIFEQVVNASITRLIYSRDNLTLSSFNEHAYLSSMGHEQEMGEVVTYR